MTEKQFDEFEEFDKVIDGLLSVPYMELQQKLDKEKQAKTQQKRKRATSSPTGRASSNSKKQVS